MKVFLPTSGPLPRITLRPDGFYEIALGYDPAAPPGRLVLTGHRKPCSWAEFRLLPDVLGGVSRADERGSYALSEEAFRLDMDRLDRWHKERR